MASSASLTLFNQQHGHLSHTDPIAMLSWGMGEFVGKGYDEEPMEQNQLEQLERLRSEDTPPPPPPPPPPRCPMITPYYWPVYFEPQVHIIDQLKSDPKSKQGESRKIRKICEKFKF